VVRAHGCKIVYVYHVVRCLNVERLELICIKGFQGRQINKNILSAEAVEHVANKLLVLLIVSSDYAP